MVRRTFLGVSGSANTVSEPIILSSGSSQMVACDPGSGGSRLMIWATDWMVVVQMLEAASFHCWAYAEGF